MYWRFVTDSPLDPYVGTGVGGYRAAKNVLDQVNGKMGDDAYGKLSDVGISAIGFEFEVSTSPPLLPSELGGLDGPIGISLIWLTNPESGDHGPHLYLFAVEGEGGVKSLSQRALGSSGSDSSVLPGSLFVLHYGGDGPQKLGDWEAAFAKVGVDAGGRGGLLSGEVTMDAGTESIFSWHRHDKMWWGFVVDLLVFEDGSDIQIEKVNYRYYEWLLSAIGFQVAPGGASWVPPEHSFWEAGNGRVPEWGGGSAGSRGGTGGGGSGLGEVCFPSGECLPIVDGPDAAYDGPNADAEGYELLAEHYWDPQNSGTELLDTSGDHWGKKLSEDILVADLAQSGSRSKTFDKARISPKLVRFLQAYLDELNERSDEGVMLDITSGYRSWWYNRETDDWPAELPAADVASIETDETGHYKWKITLEDGSVVHGNEVSKSEHCAGRGVDLHVESTSCTVSSPAAYLRDPDAAYASYTEDNPPENRNWNDIDEVVRHDDDTHWKIVNGTSVTVTDRGVGPDDQIVVEVEVDGTVVGWTNWANLDSTRNPGFDGWDLGKIALATADEREVEGVSPCDTRLGIEHAGNQWIHVDVKPRDDATQRAGGWFPYWFYTGEPDDYEGETKTRCDSFRKKRIVIDLNNDCADLPEDRRVMRVFYDTSRVYVVDNTAAYLRDPDAGYNSYTKDDPPDNRNWNSTDKVIRHDDDTHWKIVDGTEIKLTAEATGPSDQTVVKAETNESNPTVFGWTNLSNLVFK
ncbi:MAG: hypothetical protein V5A24_09075 [Haloarculaceae archaeon]